MAGPPPRPRIAYQPALDGIRAVAVAAVIAYHLGYPWAQGGFLGVDAFFVLSGFLITSLLIAEHTDTGRISLGGFWLRRARRLLPALFLMLTVVCLYAAFAIPTVQLGTLRGDAFAAIFYVSNWHTIAASQSYFALFVAPLPLTHLWSLAIEEQFYLVWPLIVLLLLRIDHGRRRALWIATIAGIVGSQIAMTLLYSATDPSRAYYGTESRAHTILIGCLLALIVRAAPSLVSRTRPALNGAGVVAFVAVVAAFSTGRPSTRYFNGGSLAFAIAVAVLILAAQAPSGWLRTLLSVRPVRYVGRISYGLYLWHWPVIVYMTEARTGLSANVLNGARVIVTFVIAVISFHFVEQPILHGRVRSRRAKVVLIPVALSVVLASVLIGTAAANDQTQAVGRITGSLGRCGPAPAFETEAAARQLRRLGGIPAVPPTHPARRLAVFGDSRACSLLTGLEVGAKSVHATVADGAVLGCGIVAGAISPKDPMMIRAWALSCQGRVRHIVDSVVAAHDPQVIVWLSGWELADLDAGGHDAMFGTEEHRQLLLGRMEALYQRSRAPGRKLVILTLPEETRGTYYIPKASTGPNTATLNAIYREFAARHPDDVTTIDLARHLCPHGAPCPPQRDGLRPRPYDGIHFSPEGAAWAAKWLWPQLLAVWPTLPR